jgi:methyl-accepting chemotaxis protein
MNGVMGWFGRTRVRNKILSGFGAVLLLMITIAFAVFLQTARAQDLSSESRRAVDTLRTADELDLALADRVAAFRDFLISGQDVALENYSAAESRFQEHLATLRSTTMRRDQLARLDEIQRAAEAWARSTAEPGIALRRQALAPGGPPLEVVADFFRTEGRVGAALARAEIEQYRQGQTFLMEESRNRREEALQGIRTVTLLSTLAAILLSLVLATWIAGVLARGINEAAEMAGHVAGGDLTRTAPVVFHDEIGDLVERLNAMAGDLRRTVSAVSATTTQVATSAEQIAAASEEMAYTVDQQVRSTVDTSSSMEQIAAQIARIAESTESLAESVELTSTSVGEMSASIEQTASSADSLGASVEQTSATIEEMVTSITRVGEHVEESQEIARAAEGDARKGGEAVEKTIHGMRRIHGDMSDLIEVVRNLGSASASIGRISEVVEDIADQTNLLALNAAIEAARAGEQGRGFSVVAQEIRRLAERSVESTREIGSTIREVIQDMERVVRSSGEVARRTDEGIQLADSAGGALEKIIGSAVRTRELMEEVALATRQQIRAAGQAQESMEHIQHVAQEVRIATRQQATGSRQIAEAVENMNRQTREVFRATGEQKKGGEMILQSTEQISQAARTTQEAIQEIATGAQDLSSQANHLTDLVAAFRV